MNSVGVGVSAAVLAFIGTEASNNFNPAEMRQEQVGACAPNLAEEAQPAAITLPKACKPFLYDRYSSNLIVTYDLPARQDFIDEFSPGEGYNKQKTLEFAGIDSVLGVFAGTLAAGFMFMKPGPKPNNPPATPKSPATMSVGEYRRRYARRANKLPLDNLTNDELRQYVVQIRHKQPPAN